MLNRKRMTSPSEKNSFIFPLLISGLVQEDSAAGNPIAAAAAIPACLINFLRAGFKSGLVFDLCICIQILI